MDKYLFKKIKGEERDPLVREGVEEYYDEKREKERENFIDKGEKYEDTYENLLKIFKIISENKIDAHNFEDDWECYNYLENEFKRIVELKLQGGDFVGIVNFGKEMLREASGLKEIEKLDPQKPGDAILITEAINWSAKIYDGAFYALKPAMIVASAKIGAQIGKEYSGDWSIYYLFNRDSGVASFHDPNDEVIYLFDLIGNEKSIEDWEFGWSGVRRQDLAYYLISDKERLFFQRMRYATLPGENSREKKKLFDQIEKKYSI